MEKMTWRVIVNNGEFSSVAFSDVGYAESCSVLLESFFPNMKIAIMGQVEETINPHEHYEDLLSEW